MIQRRGGSGFAQDRSGALILPPEHLHGHLALERAVVGPVDGGEPSLADLLLDAEVRDHAARAELFGGIDRRPPIPVLRAQAAGLQRPQNPDDLFRPATDAEAVDDLVLHDRIGIDDVESAKRYALTFEATAVGPRHRTVGVTAERERGRPQPGCGIRRRDPLLVRFESVGAYGEHVGAELHKLLVAVAHG